jgi:hypothetical protein
MKNYKNCTSIAFFFFVKDFATDYPVSSSDEIKKLKLKPGDGYTKRMERPIYNF